MMLVIKRNFRYHFLFNYFCFFQFFLLTDLIINTHPNIIDKKINIPIRAVFWVLDWGQVFYVFFYRMYVVYFLISFLLYVYFFIWYFRFFNLFSFYYSCLFCSSVALFICVCCSSFSLLFSAGYVSFYCYILSSILSLLYQSILLI